MLSIFNKKTTPTLDYAVLGLDLHSHLVPGIDDGADSPETAVALIRQLIDMGYQRLYTTPHVMSDLYPNNPDSISDGLSRLKQALQQAGIQIEIDAAAEYYMDDTFEHLITEDHELLTLPGNRVLVEMSFVSAPPGLFHYIFRLQTKGYQPVLAHPERYLFLKKNFSQYERLKEYGCEFQLNLLSLIGHYGQPIQETAHKLLKNNMIDFIGTDLHHQRHAELLQKALADKMVQRYLSQYPFKNTELMAVMGG
ncbi:MAG: hypothetical protein HUU34_17990 [Saprospiraceae bacterium]|jgi:tyrosine-protein phosphatase YwqE|nr:hypothetical protein [Saprospiraceae bacterium]